jgi:TRAP-type C4-dicarboxylate transport system permease small subunit
MMHVAFRLRLARLILRVFYVIGAIALMAMMGIVVANIIGRIFIRTPITGTLEIAGFAGVIIAAVAVGFAEREHRNIIVDVLARRFPPRVRSIADRFTFLLSLGAVGFLFWAVAESALESFTTGEITLTLGIHIFPFRVAWAAGLLFLFGLLLFHLIEPFMRRVKR